MKFFLTVLMTLSTLPSFAANLSEDLKNKECSIEFTKNIFVRESDSMTQLGKVMFAPLINERNLLLKKGSHYPIVESDEEVIVINERSNIVFLCITDDSEECVKISEIKTAQFSELSDNNLKLHCK